MIVIGKLAPLEPALQTLSYT